MTVNTQAEIMKAASSAPSIRYSGQCCWIDCRMPRPGKTVISDWLTVVLARIGADPFTRDGIRQVTLGDSTTKNCLLKKLSVDGNLRTGSQSYSEPWIVGKPGGFNTLLTLQLRNRLL